MANHNPKKQATETREKLFLFILAFIVDKGYPPTMREIRDGIGLRGVTTIYRHLERLEGEGRIERDLDVARGIRIPASVREEYLVEYRCIHPVGCKSRSDRPGICSTHGGELVAFVSKLERSPE